MSTSFVTLDKISPVEFLSKYFNGSLFIFLDMLVLNFLANLFATSVIAIDWINVNKALAIYVIARPIAIPLTASISIVGSSISFILSGILSICVYICDLSISSLTLLITFRASA